MALVVLFGRCLCLCVQNGFSTMQIRENASGFIIYDLGETRRVDDGGSLGRRAAVGMRKSYHFDDIHSLPPPLVSFGVTETDKVGIETCLPRILLSKFLVRFDKCLTNGERFVPLQQRYNFCLGGLWHDCGLWIVVRG